MMKFLRVCDHSKLVLEEAKVVLSKFISSDEYLNNIRRTSLTVMTFIDVKKAFDSINRDTMWKILR